MSSQAPPLSVVVVSPQQQRVSHGSSSVGPVVGVLVAILILGAMAVMVGRLCSGKRIMGYGNFDLETWAETKCSSCIDGRIQVNTPLPKPNDSAVAAAAASQ
ncbi:hypothetical protein CsatB_008583 [Cannabis sativa]|uniref:Uncharacterized protein n=2 Tax=Cannabis sativa TaxID=3483 RepID=A0A7J6H545_CANSA|nr:hypothetical protein F8388_013796 [Cannabis sativa]KAF4390354.1 hypothetical protein G4B88_024360 [Cannabis sativa]